MLFTGFTFYTPLPRDKVAKYIYYVLVYMDKS